MCCMEPSGGVTKYGGELPASMRGGAELSLVWGISKENAKAVQAAGKQMTGQWIHVLTKFEATKQWGR